jgi:poly-gamma-glutamate capsule biosynthesis protein CapA/YwtB (metallophosphatase superfamily)
MIPSRARTPLLLLAVGGVLLVGLVAFAIGGTPRAPLTAGGTPTPSLPGTVGPGASASPTPSSPVGGTATPTPTASSTPSSHPGELRLVAAGDVMLARSVGKRIASSGPEWPFQQVASILQGADIAIVNLECTMGTLGKPEPKHYRFRAPSAAAEVLKLAGIDAVSQANNHVLDYGRSAFAQAQELLAAQGIEVAGAGKDRAAAHTPVIMERNGVRIALLAYADVPVESGGFDHQGWIATESRSGMAWFELATMRQDIQAARAEADHVVVFFHFGIENRSTPTAAQRREAHAAIDAGASLVIGAHPHVLQGTERYHDGLIAYGLGNFVFDGGGWTLANRDSAILEVSFTKDSIGEPTWHPLVVQRSGQPRPATAAESRRILRRVAPLP